MYYPGGKANRIFMFFGNTVFNYETEKKLQLKDITNTLDILGTATSHGHLLVTRYLQCECR